MNLDNYRALLNQKIDTNAQAEHLDERAIAAAIHGKATNLAAKINRAILWEGGCLVVVVAAAAAILVAENNALVQLLAAVGLLICIVMAIVYVWKYRQLRQLVAFESDTATLLAALIVAVRQYITVYVWIMVISTLVGFVLGGLYGYLELEDTNNLLPSQLSAWYAIPASLFTIAVIAKATHWYMLRVYGKPLQALVRCAAQLAG